MDALECLGVDADIGRECIDDRVGVWGVPCTKDDVSTERVVEPRAGSDCAGEKTRSGITRPSSGATPVESTSSSVLVDGASSAE